MRIIIIAPRDIAATLAIGALYLVALVGFMVIV